MHTVTHSLATEELAAPREEFYRKALLALNAARVPYLIGGGFAFDYYTGLHRPSKDFDIFIREEQIRDALAAMEGMGCETDLKFPHWLGKAFFEDLFIDFIFNSGNGVAGVDDQWFDHAEEAELFGAPVLMAPGEEIIWSKSFIMERERY
ncbi:MAG TPA: hypothetical protein VM534_09550, partial [Thermoanaerobaculia bacterium]|nr:hypothetical protein [Thermoanaerobaculia bacterium]